MFDAITPDHPHLADRLPADAYWQLVRTLRLTLPPPPTDSPDDLARRDHAAIARIAAQAELAAQFVAASEQWKDCLKLARERAREPNVAAKCRAQALSMMRQANSALRLLLRMQELRAKREADSAACDRAAWTEHRAIVLMAEALSPQAAAPPTGAAPHPAPAPVQQPEAAPLAAAEHATLYPERAPLI